MRPPTGSFHVLQSDRQAAFRVLLDDLRQGPRHIRAAFDEAWLDWALSGCEYPLREASGAIDVTLEALSGGVLLRGSARMTVETDCGICLACARLDIESEVGCFLLPRPEGFEQEDEAELTPEDLEREWYSGDEIRIDDIVRDALMLELPMTPRCRADCTVPGLSPGQPAGPVARPVDPRLAPLAAFLNRTEGE
jgi:uncharacterized protein